MLSFTIGILIVEVLVSILFFTPFKKHLSGFLNHPVLVRFGAPLVRLCIGVMFAASCWPKFSAPQGFAVLVAQYQFLPAFSVNFFSLWLPAFEITIAAGLLLTKWNREFSFLSVVLMGMFIVAVGQTLIRNLPITCGCFEIDGAMDKGLAWLTFLRDVALMWPLTWLFLKDRNRYLWDLRKV